MTQKVMTLSEVAEATRIPPATLRYYRHEGRGPRSFRAGRKVVYFERDVIGWLEERADADRFSASA